MYLTFMATTKQSIRLLVQTKQYLLRHKKGKILLSILLNMLLTNITTLYCFYL